MQPDFVAIVIKDDMSSQDLIEKRKDFQFIKSKLAGVPISLPNLSEEIDVDQIKETYNAHKFEISNPAEVEPFLTAFEPAIQKDEGEATKWYVIRINYLSDSETDQLINTIDSMLAMRGKYIMAMTGSSRPIHSDYLNLQQQSNVKADPNPDA